jgi:hypothetical protein
MSLDFATYAQWSGWFTLACLLLALLGFAFRWGLRFRLVGITGFMAVLTVGLFGLGLGLFARTEIPGAVRFSLVYDNGANHAVISLPATVTESELAATLQQAAEDLFSYGRTGIGSDNKLTIRARILLHPEPGISQPLYVGEVRRSLATRQDEQMEVKIFEDKLAQALKYGENQRQLPQT